MDSIEISNYLEKHRFKVSEVSYNKLDCFRKILNTYDCVAGAVVQGSHTYGFNKSNSDMDSTVFINDGSNSNDIDELKLEISKNLDSTETPGIHFKTISPDIIKRDVKSLIEYFSAEISVRDPLNLPNTFLPDLFLMQIGSKKIDLYRKIVLDEIGKVDCGNEIWQKYLSSELLVIFNKNNRLGNSKEYNEFVEKRDKIIPTSIEEARKYFAL